MTDQRCDLIWKILALDRETYCGIDDPHFLEEMRIDDLRKYYAKMCRDLGIKPE